MGDDGGGGIPDLAGEVGKGVGKIAGGLDDVTEAVAEGSAPLLAPGVLIGGVFRPMQAVFQDFGDVFGLERCVRAVPAEHAQDGEFRRIGILVEVGEGDLAVVAFAEGGDEEDVCGIPALAVGRVGRVPLFDDEGVEDAAEDDNGQLGLAELDEEDSEGLSAGQRAELADGAILEFLRFLVLEAEFVGVVFEGEFFEIVIRNRPVEFVAKVGDEVFEVGDGAEVGGH